MAGADLAVASGNGHVELVAAVAELEDAEALADGVDRSEPTQGLLEEGEFEAMNLDVPVLDGTLEQVVADATADDEGASSGSLDGFSDPTHAIRQRQVERGHCSP